MELYKVEFKARAHFDLNPYGIPVVVGAIAEKISPGRVRILRLAAGHAGTEKHGAEMQNPMGDIKNIKSLISISKAPESCER